MATDLKQLSQAIKDSSPRTRMVAIGGALLVVVAIVLSSVIASQPHFVLLHGQVDDQARVSVEKALAGAGIRYRISQPPGPFVIDVDEAQFYEAQNAVAIAGAMKSASSGIETGASGATTVFMTSAERAQTMQKREWQELENQLACLDFVASAKVTTSIPDNSPLRPKKAVTVSVTLALRGQTELSAEQMENLARLVRYRFDVPAENVVVTDQKGHTLFAGEVAGDANMAQTKDHSEYTRSFEHALEEKANAALSRAYGPNKGYVTLATQWDFDLRTIEADIVQPKGVLVSDDKTDSVTPPGATTSDAGGAAGTASNIAPETAPAATPATPPAAIAPATTSDQKRKYETGRTKTRTVHSAPTMQRMSVSLVLDESLASKKDEITQLVQASVGFEKSREDVMSVSTTTIATAVADPGGAAPATPVSEGLSPTMKTLLRHGVEFMAAAAFLFVAVKALKGNKRVVLTAVGAGGAGPTGSSGGANRRTIQAGVESDDVEPDPELIARMRVEELVRSDPRRVGEILSRWATESTKTAGSSR